MAQNKFALARYQLIKQMLNRRTYVKTAEIVEACSKKLGFKVCQRTIQLDMEALRNDPFLGYFLPIKYDKQRKAYYYREETTNLFLAFYITQEEIAFLTSMKGKLKDKISESEYEIFISLCHKIETEIKR